MHVNDVHWVTEDWGIRKYRRGSAGNKIIFAVVFTKEMQAHSGPFHYSKFQAKKDILRIGKYD